MADAHERDQSPPTHYANVVTSVLTVDELVMELRRIDKPHRVTDPSVPYIVIPPPSTEEVMSQQPVARIVMTFSAAKALKEYLDITLPRIEEARKTGKPLQ